LPGYPGELFLRIDSINATYARTDMLTIPLKNAGRFYMIEAIVDNQFGNLIFDTGASELVLNGTYFRKYFKREVNNSRGITGNIEQADR
jgi:hypothetical protein